MEVSDIHERRGDFSGENTTALYENTVITEERNKVEKVQEKEGHYEKLRLHSKPVKNKDIPHEADSNRLKLMVNILAASVLVLFIAVSVLIIITVVPKGDDYGWTNWGTWSTCTVTCGGGTQIQTRTCANPKPSDLGDYCIGDPIHIQPCNQTGCSPIASAFSVDHPDNYISFHGIYKLTFFHTIYQHGGDFDPSTGTFNCSILGIYHFSVTLVKKRANTRVDAVMCYLYKSGSPMIYIRMDPTDDETDKGHAAISQSIVTHMYKNNTVYLTRCIGQPSSSMEYWSSFTGFLLYPDS